MGGRTTTLDVDEGFVPCPVAEGDELFPNGVFVFNVTRILAHLARHPEDAALVSVAVGSFPRWREVLADAHIEAADLARPLVLAEIAPGSFNVIDGHHRLEKARRHGVDMLQAYRLGVTQHLPFLTSTKAYRTFVAYWNGKVEVVIPEDVFEKLNLRLGQNVEAFALGNRVELVPVEPIRTFRGTLPGLPPLEREPDRL